jgi:Uroporphyrinogen-III decarboxylase
MNTKFSNACNRVSQKCPPIWFMRQAGRYHSHYQKLKEKYTFDQLCKTPELAAEVALGPIQEFDFDVSILFSDIVYPFQGLGIDLTFDPGPVLAEKITQQNYEQYLDLPKAIEFMQFQADAIRATRNRLPADKS